MTCKLNITPVLSIIVITHEQREELKRCLDSILAMEMPFGYEIIVSDDRSTDGTREMLEKEYADKVIATYCNSDEGACANNSQRSGYNRCNAYPLAKGKYIAFVDADDYFEEGTNVYAHQVEMLEKHPECVLCMANMMTLCGDEKIEDLWRHGRKEGEVITPAQYFAGIFIQNQAFVARNIRETNPVVLYGTRFVDAIITDHYLQYGNIVCVDDYGYVYIHHEKSISGEMTKRIDGWVMYCKGLYIPLLIPRWRDQLYKVELKMIYKVVKYALAGERLEEKNKRALEDLHVYIYDCFNRKLSLVDYCRLNMARFVLWRTIKRENYTHRIGNWIEKLLIHE